MLLLAGCSGPAQLRPELAAAGSGALGLSDALEKLIEEGKDTDEDRKAAYERAQTLPAETAEDAFGRAAIAGRLAERKGALALLGEDSPTSLVGEAEKYARLSRKLDPEFRQGAATRMLGSLYIFAPANLLEGGNSEDGIQILEHLVSIHPDLPENQLRLADGYVALSDNEPARKPICLALAQRDKLRRDDATLADKLAKILAPLDCKTVLGEAPAPAPAPTEAQPPAPTP